MSLEEGGFRKGGPAPPCISHAVNSGMPPATSIAAPVM